MPQQNDCLAKPKSDALEAAQNLHFSALFTMAILSRFGHNGKPVNLTVSGQFPVSTGKALP